MQPQQILSTVAAYLQNIRDLAGQIAPTFDAETIHKFRVETKRLRALLRLASTEDESLQVRLGKRFKEMYAALGELRDAQMHLVRVVKEPEPPLPDYALWLAARVGEGQRRWVAAYGEKVIPKLEARMAAVAWPELRPQTLRRFVTEHIACIQETLLNTDLDDEDLHDIRKRIKDLQHILKWVEKAWPEGMAALEGIPLGAVESLAERAGEYNDERNALDTLGVFIGENEAAGKAEETVRQRWILSRDRNRAALVKAIDDFRASLDADAKP